ncbi:MAG: glucose-6-phosphate isomerase family protein [Anaerolineales bacterium]
MQPFATHLDLRSGALRPAGPVVLRRLSDVGPMFADQAAVAGILEREGDRLIYEVYPVDLPEEPGQVLHGSTILYPGRVGDQFHMTKGHFHTRRDRAEVYLCLSGRGALLLQTEDGQTRLLPMEPGTVAYVPPYWGHRTANTGDEPFVFFAAWPGDSGHDYAAVERGDFPKILVARGGQAILIDNPRVGAPRPAKSD